MRSEKACRGPVLAALLGLALSPAGCGPSPSPNPARVAVTGRVTLDDAPAPAGTIVFVPVAVGQMQAQGIIQDDGTFAIAAADGPSPGEYRVEIQCAKKTGRRVASLSSSDGTGMIDERVPVVPARYNTATTLRQAIAPGENALEFQLRSKP
ncbi:hypothetical protein [Gemmata sp.]|uniref:hypothetical protein n=1 Tax=Gemmata sp. TaxID=1914242 RepID=UPI003F71C8D7